MNIKAKLRKWLNLDNAIDLAVDFILIIFEAFTTPILIPIRLGKHFMKATIKNVSKRYLKKKVKPSLE
jgi:hypothetical protein